MVNAAIARHVAGSNLESVEVQHQEFQGNPEVRLRDFISEEMSIQSPDKMDILASTLKRTSPHDLDLGPQHTHTINPFHFQPRARTMGYLQSFLRLNGTFFFFDDQSLTNNFELAYAADTPLPNRIMAELCLALAIGDQWDDSGNDANCLM
jgi:hypothetical protein